MKIKIAETQREYFDLMFLRKEVFSNEQKVDINIEMDEKDREAIHFIGSRDEEIIATCRLVVDGTSAKLGRMAIAKSFRRQNLGRQLIAYVEDYAKKHNILKIVASAQIQALDFYLKNGYQIDSELFYEADIPHKTVYKKLDR